MSAIRLKPSTKPYSPSRPGSSKPRFHDPDMVLAQNEMAYNAGIPTRQASDEFVDFLRSRTPAAGGGNSPVESYQFLRNIADMGDVLHGASPFSQDLVAQTVVHINRAPPVTLRQLGLSNLREFRRRLIQAQQSGMGITGTNDARVMIEQVMREVGGSR